jgi:putative ABC transport system permease protein
MKFLKLLRFFILRNFRQEKFFTSLSIIGIALGIGLFTGVKVASDRAIESFESEIRGINPHANYQILDLSGLDFDERVYKDIRRLEENSLPVLKTFGYLSAVKDTIDMQGIYTTKALRFFYPADSRDLNLEDFYREINGVIITKNFSDRHRIKDGDILKALIYDKEYELKVVAVVNFTSLLPNTVIMDIGNFQEYFGKIGFLTRIDLLSDEATAGSIRRVLPSNLRVEKKEEIFRNQKAIVASFRYNLQFISLIAVLAGVFLLYNSVFISVVKRRTEIGILRGLGAGKKTVVLLFIVQGVILGSLGSLLGIIFGQFAAYFSVIAVEKTISTMYSTIPVTGYAITRGDALTALLLGISISVLASVIPSYEASKIRPNESSREGSFEGRYRKYQPVVSVVGFLCIMLGGIISYFDYRHMPFSFPFPAFTGILFIIAGFTLISPFYLSMAMVVAKKPLEKIFGAVGKITVGDMRGSIYRFSVALMSVAISSALIIAFLTIIFSLRNSLTGWIHKNITADVYIKPASCRSNYCFYPVSEKVIDTVRNLPGVEGIDRFRGLQLDFLGKKVTVGFADTGVKRKFLHRKLNDRKHENILKEMEGDEQVAGISEFLSIRHGLKRGDIIKLQSPGGEVEFRINDIFSSYATTSGFIYIDRKWLKKYWGIDDATQFGVYLKENADTGQFIRTLREKLPPEYSLEIFDNQGLRDKVFDIFDKSFAITYAIELISIIVSLIGVVNTLLALVFERKREISILRYLGASWKQVQQNFLLSAGITGITGILLGFLMGPLMSVILIHVVNKISFGWEIQFEMPLLYLSVVMLLLFITTLSAGLIPSRAARSIEPKKFISFE